MEDEKTKDDNTHYYTSNEGTTNTTGGVCYIWLCWLLLTRRECCAPLRILSLSFQLQLRCSSHLSKKKIKATSWHLMESLLDNWRK
jgi:hypothetical protein